MRVATWNVLHGLDLRTGRVDLPAVAAAIDALDVTVVAVQEVDREQLRTGGVDQVAELAGMLGWHGIFAPALLGDPAGSRRPAMGTDPGGPAYGIGLLSRHSLHGVARRLLPGVAGQRPVPGWDNEPRVVLRAEVGRTGLVVATTHLSYLPWRGLRQLRSGLRWAAAARAAVLMGDLNLSGRMLGPVLARTSWRTASAGPTFPACCPVRALDHILARGRLLSEVRVGRGGPSDHLPVVGRMALTAG